MSALPHASLLCPGCYRDFRVAAWRVLPGAELGCPHCHDVLRIDGSRPEHLQAIAQAEAAQQRQREKVERLKTLVAPQPAPNPATPDALDGMIEQLRSVLDEDFPGIRRRG